MTLGALLVAVVSGATWRLFTLPASYAWAVGGMWLGLAVVLVAVAPPDLPGPGVGQANRVTLLRAVLVAGVTGLVFVPGRPGEPLLWWAIVLSTVSMLLDGVDGWVARRTGTATAFGARFDMELDAFLMLVLSALVWESGKAGAWILFIGILRYLFVAAGWIRRELQAELPVSLRRKTVCVIQGVVLLVALGPIIPAPMAAGLAAVALLALLYSFGVDVAWLVGRKKPSHGA